MRSAIALLCLLLACAAPKPVKPELPAPGAVVARVYVGASFLAARQGLDVEVASATNVAASRKTDGCGVALLEPLADGVYTVTARDGVNVTLVEQVKVQAGKDANVEIHLQSPPAAGKAAGSACTPPIVVSGPNPEPTAESLEHRIQGCMVLSCKIGADGKVPGCRAVEPLEYLTEPVLASMKKRIYQPSLCAGVATAVDDYLVRIFIRMRYDDPPLDAPPANWPAK